MAYSRWIDSKFYTYWVSMNSVYDKGDEVFIVHSDLKVYQKFTYVECKELIESRIKLKGRMNSIDNDEEAEELQNYMKRFITDVDKEYLEKVRGGQ